MQNIGGILFGAFVGFWLGRAIFVWLLDVSRGVEIAGIGALAVVGALVGIAGAMEERAKAGSRG